MAELGFKKINELPTIILVGALDWRLIFFLLFSNISRNFNFIITLLIINKYCILPSSKSLGWCHKTSNDPNGLFYKFFMEIFHCIFTRIHAVFICNRIPKRIIHIFGTSLAVYDNMDFLNGKKQDRKSVHVFRSVTGISEIFNNFLVFFLGNELLRFSRK